MQFAIEQPGLNAFLTTYGDGRWVLIFSDDQERDKDAILSMVFRAIGRSDLEIEIVATGRWELLYARSTCPRIRSARSPMRSGACRPRRVGRGSVSEQTFLDPRISSFFDLSALFRESNGYAPQDLFILDSIVSWLHTEELCRQYIRLGSVRSRNRQ